MMGKLLVVTGGTKGIGRAIAYKFASQGFDIITCARNQHDLIQLQQDLQAKFKIQTFILAADLSKKVARENFIEFVKTNSKVVDVLVNNTGFFIPGQINSEEDGVLEQMIETNLYSAYQITRGLIKEMIARKSGHIFTICSTASITPYTNGGSYCVSKYALYGMTKVLREEMKEHNVKVTAVLPGATLTASWEGVDLPPERFMKAEDVAEMIFATYSLSPSAVVEDILIRPMLGDLS
jgi:short-subunit dehydrogenase